jgi:hypothetical protein
MSHSKISLKKYPWILLLFLCSGCIKEIVYEVGNKEDRLVIYGVLSDQPGRHIFRITRTNAFEKQADANPVTGASLYVADSKSRKYPFVELGSGSYLFQDTLFRALAGETYYLDVVIPNVGHYRSDVEVMPAPISMDSTVAKAIREGIDTRLHIFVNTRIPSDPRGVYLRWKTTRVWRRTSVDFGLLTGDFFRNPPPVVCYMTEDPEPNAIRIFGSKRRDAFDLKSQEVLNMNNDDKFYERNVFEVIQYRISEKNHDYWVNLNKVTNQSGTIFDPPPAMVQGNIYNFDDPKLSTLGYFELAAVDTAHVRVEQDLFLPFPIPDPCLQDFRNSSWRVNLFFSPECAYCTNIKGHSVIKPKYWEK